MVKEKRELVSIMPYCRVTCGLSFENYLSKSFFFIENLLEGREKGSNNVVKFFENLRFVNSINETTAV